MGLSHGALNMAEYVKISDTVHAGLQPLLPQALGAPSSPPADNRHPQSVGLETSAVCGMRFLSTLH